MSLPGLLEPATQLFHYLFEQASLGIALQDFAENISGCQASALIPAGDPRLPGSLFHSGVCV
jgi:hypothetical protein